MTTITLSTALKTTRTLSIGTAALLTYSSILLLGAAYTLVTVAIAVAYHAHERAGYTPLLSAAPTIQSPQLLLPPAPPKVVPTIASGPIMGCAIPLEAPTTQTTPLIPLKKATVVQLRALATDLGGIAGSGKMKKAQLVAHLENLGYESI